MRKIKLILSGVCSISVVTCCLAGIPKQKLTNRVVWYSVVSLDACTFSTESATITANDNFLFAGYATTHEGGNCKTFRSVYQVTD